MTWHTCYRLILDPTESEAPVALRQARRLADTPLPAPRERSDDMHKGEGRERERKECAWKKSTGREKERTRETKEKKKPAAEKE